MYQRRRLQNSTYFLINNINSLRSETSSNETRINQSNGSFFLCAIFLLCCNFCASPFKDAASSHRKALLRPRNGVASSKASRTATFSSLFVVVLCNFSTTNSSSLVCSDHCFWILSFSVFFNNNNNNNKQTNNTNKQNTVGVYFIVKLDFNISL